MSDAPIDARPVDPAKDRAERDSQLHSGALHVAQAARARRTARWEAVLILVGTAGILGVAAWLKPDPRGFGTHQQLGGGPCGMLLWTGLPCPTCSMTTAFAHTVRGQFLSAARVQPAGFLFALATIAAALGAVAALITGRAPRWWRTILLRVPAHWLFLAALIILVGGWGYKLVYGLATHELPMHSVIATPAR